jgi:hypothetical protein
MAAEDQPPERLDVAPVRYLGGEGSDDPAVEFRIDLINPDTKDTVASLLPDDACTLAVRMLQEAFIARCRAAPSGGTNA